MIDGQIERPFFKIGCQKPGHVCVTHNHPSGDPQPSQEDMTLTERLVGAGKLLGIQMLDHVVIGDGTESYHSFADESLLNSEG